MVRMNHRVFSDMGGRQRLQSELSNKKPIMRFQVELIDIAHVSSISTFSAL